MATPPASPDTTENASDDLRTAVLPSKPYLFVVLHGDRPLEGGARYDLSKLDLVTIGRGAARSAEPDRQGDRRTLDVRLAGRTISSTHARLIHSGGSWIFEDAQSKNGSFLNGERVSRATLRDGDFLEIGSTILRYRANLPSSGGAPEIFDSREQPVKTHGFATLLPQLAEQYAALAQIAAMPVAVLLLGETGTGKEVLARAVHSLSGRSGAFVAVNCGGLPASLLESQLFGHLKGAFPGAARDEPGYIRSADRGTLFLDEIGDLPLPAQAALLRVLQEREVVPVGSTRATKVDLRVIAATHKPLEQMAARGEFRSDLLARLSGYRHQLVPLRARIEDLGVLVGDLLHRSEIPNANQIQLSNAAARRLLRHGWPLNIRQLQQHLAVAAVFAKDGIIEPAHLPEATVNAPSSHPSSKSDPTEPLDPDTLRQTLVALLEKHQGKVSHVARDMGKARMQIHRWMQRFGIDPNQYRPGSLRDE